MLDKSVIGRMGEAKAEEFLVGQAFRIVERNYRSRLGEVDIIAWDRDELVFIEVRARSSSSFGSPEETVGIRKQRKLRRLAAQYLAWKVGKEINCRFDVVTLLFDGEGQVLQINHYRGAF